MSQTGLVKSGISKSRRKTTHVLGISVTSILIVAIFSLSLWQTIATVKGAKSSTRPLVCPRINGNQDMYGLGIRLGIYVQLVLTSVVDILGHHNSSLSLAPPTLWFLVAMFVALLTMMHDSTTYAVESYIVISLGNGITWTLVGGATKLDPLTLRESFLTSFSRFLIWGLWRGASSVYWWSLQSNRYREVPDSCGPWGWLFTKVRLEGGYQTFQKVVNIISWLGLLYSLLPYVIGSIYFVSVVSRMDTSDLKDQRQVTKLAIFCDYMFVEIGELRRIVFGTPKSNPPAAHSRSNSSEFPMPNLHARARADAENQLELQSQITAAISQSQDIYGGRGELKAPERIKKHIYQHYKLPRSKSSPTQAQDNINDAQHGTQRVQPEFKAGARNGPQAHHGPHHQKNESNGALIASSQQPSSSDTKENNAAGKHSQGQTSPTPASKPGVDNGTPQTQNASVAYTATNSNQKCATIQAKLSSLYWARDKIVCLIHKCGMNRFPFLAFWNTCSILTTILTVEFTLELNNIYDVYSINSAGQLVAFIVGVGGAFIAIGDYYVQMREKIIVKRSGVGVVKRRNE